MDATAAALAAVGIDGFARPWLLGLMLGAAALGGLLHARRRPPALGFGAAVEARAGSGRDAVRGIALALRAAALFSLAAVLAGPVGTHPGAPEPGRGLDLVLVVDASGSMRALDTRVGGGWRTRLDLAREVVSRFAEQRAAAGDRVALVVFGDTAFTQVPLTSDGALLSAALARVEAGMAGEATALGDALALAVKRVQLAPGAEADAGRAIVLLTDGRHNAGSFSVELAAALATETGVRVHTVAIGTAGQAVAMAAPHGAARRGPRLERHDVDVAVLERVAATTGGRFFPARRSGDLEAVYAAIDALERVERRLPPRRLQRERPEPLLALAGGLLFAEIGLARVARRRLP